MCYCNNVANQTISALRENFVHFSLNHDFLPNDASTAYSIVRESRITSDVSKYFYVSVRNCCDVTSCGYSC